MNKSTKTTKERLDALTEKTDRCWTFKGSLNSKGYGQFRDGKMKKAHRVSYEIHSGAIPSNLQVLHKCDNPSCVNPGHLFLGDNNENIRDKVRKGRQSSLKGSINPSSKLNETQVSIIRKLLKTNATTHKEIASTFDVSRSAISAINNKQNWKHI